MKKYSGLESKIVVHGKGTFGKRKKLKIPHPKKIRMQVKQITLLPPLKK